MGINFKLSTMVAGAVMLASLASSAQAATVWDFSLADAGGDSATGQITTTGSGPNFTLTGVSGIFDGQTISGLDGTYAGPDNIFYSAGPYVSFGGWSFDLAGGPLSQVNIWYGSGNYWLDLNPPDSAGSGPDAGPLTSFSVTAVPEPSIWAMLLIGFAGVGFMLRRSREHGALLAA